MKLLDIVLTQQLAGEIDTADDLRADRRQLPDVQRISQLVQGLLLLGSDAVE